MPHVIKPAESSPEAPKGPRMEKAQTPMPTPSTVGPIGRWMAYHARWQTNMDILGDGKFKTLNQGGGSWTFDGRNLMLKWASNRPRETLVLQPDGTFYRMCAEGSFVLRKC